MSCPDVVHAEPDGHRAPRSERRVFFIEPPSECGVRRNWRKRVGIEPTGAGSPAPNGFKFRAGQPAPMRFRGADSVADRRRAAGGWRAAHTRMMAPAGGSTHGIGQTRDLDVDVLSSAAGRPGWPAQSGLRQLIKAHNENLKRNGGARRWRSPWRSLRRARDRIARYFGRRSRSEGAARAVPDFEKRGCRSRARSTDDGVWFLTKRRKFPLPIVPPAAAESRQLRRLARPRWSAWLAQQAEAEGVDLFPGSLRRSRCSTATG